MRAEEDAAVDGDPAIDFNVGEGILKETWMVGGQQWLVGWQVGVRVIKKGVVHRQIRLA
jgi:hypothetical protein